MHFKSLLLICIENTAKLRLEGDGHNTPRTLLLYKYKYMYTSSFFLKNLPM